MTDSREPDDVADAPAVPDDAGADLVADPVTDDEALGAGAMPDDATMDALAAGEPAATDDIATADDPVDAPATIDEPADEEGTVDEPAATDEPADAPPATDEPASDAVNDPDPDPDPDQAVEADGSRPAGLRVAALHLRTVPYTIARAELEAFAGRGLLDEPALLDLAEVRWRTGDLVGAAEAANALLARGSEEPLALAIAAEAIAALGRPGEARRLALRVVELRPAPLDALFAGMPMASIWPMEAPRIVPINEVPMVGSDVSVRQRRPRRSAATRDDTVAASPAAVEAFAGGRGALAAGDHGRAALMLGVALRLEPGFAGAVLGAVAGRDEDPLLALVEGDALRLLGREAEALAAFDRAGGRRDLAPARGAGSAEPPGPGFFDEELDET